MKNIYIILTQTGTIVSKTLQFFTRDEFNHASLCIDEDFSKFYSFGRLKINNILSGGFLVENAFTHVLGKFENVPCMILEKNITDEQYDTICSTLNLFLKNHDTYGYDFLNLFLAKTNLKVDNENRFFCSEFVAYVLSQADIHIPNIKEKIRPIEFCNLDDIKIIYKGELKRWCKARQNLASSNI